MRSEDFKRPARKYLPVPFWSWNDRLQSGELQWQINQMDEQQMGGFFMHSRKGLLTPYLSEEWLARIKDCIREAKRKGMYAWLYDEDKWPSGFCGGLIPKLGAAYRQKALLMRENDLDLPADQVALLKAYACRKEGPKQYCELQNIAEAEIPLWRDKGATILFFYKWTQPLGPNRFNNTAWVDLLNPDVTDAFLEHTHEKYRQAIGAEFGQCVPGIFTDESSILYWSYAPKVALPWSQDFEAYFAELNGYDITIYLPYLFLNLAGFEKYRYDYWHTVTYYFTQNYVKRIYDWCETNKLRYTGHFLAEDYFEFTMQYIGSLMPLYEYMHIPGVDHLNNNINDIMTIKQVTSVAEQLGKERTLCEMFGCSGQNMSFEDQKWILDWTYIHGINLTNTHLALYSMQGERKRDYPPNLFYQQPWWKFAAAMSDYVGRLSYLLTRGERITEVLVIHPMESAWCVYSPTDFVLKEEGQFDTPETWIEYQPDRQFKVNQLSYEFDRLLNLLLQVHIDYDLGDESLIAKYGCAAEEKLVVGKKAYRVVVVPPCVTLRRMTVNLLRHFCNRGGKVIFLEDPPYLVDGDAAPQNLLEELWKAAEVIPPDETIIQNRLRESLDNCVTITGAGNEMVWYHLRREGGETIAFFANTDRNQAKEVEITLKAVGLVQEWDPLSGEIKDIDFEVSEGRTQLRHSFPPCGSLMLVIDADKKMPAQRLPSPQKTSISWSLSNTWQISLPETNSLTVDFCSYTDCGGQCHANLPMHRVFDLMRQLRGQFSLTYRFTVADWDGSCGALVMESPARFAVTVNGTPLNARFGAGYYRDKSFKTAAIADLVRPGVNEVILSGVWQEDLEIEAIYITGNFQVRNENNRQFQLAMPSLRRVTGNLTQQGYPFYAGDLEFTQIWPLQRKEEGRYLLEIEQEGSIVVQALVNGKLVGSALWRPYCFDVTPYLQAGENEVKVILTTSLHNLLGPHHSTKGEIKACAPASFRDEKNWTDSYHFVELGIRAARIVHEEASRSHV